MQEHPLGITYNFILFFSAARKRNAYEELHRTGSSRLKRLGGPKPSHLMEVFDRNVHLKLHALVSFEGIGHSSDHRRIFKRLVVFAVGDTEIQISGSHAPDKSSPKTNPPNSIYKTFDKDFLIQFETRARPNSAIFRTVFLSEEMLARIGLAATRFSRNLQAN